MLREWLLAAAELATTRTVGHGRVLAARWGEAVLASDLGHSLHYFVECPKAADSGKFWAHTKPRTGCQQAGPQAWRSHGWMLSTCWQSVGAFKRQRLHYQERMRLDLIQRQFQTLGINQKDLAGKIYDKLERENQRALTTIESKLSKLLSGSNEGRKAFMQAAVQGALAASLDVPENVLADWLAGEAILLDPTLPIDLTTTLRGQVAGCNVELIDVLTPAGASPRDALRAASDQREDAIVALATEQDMAFYEGRGRRVSLLVNRHLSGAKLTRYPDLVPSLPPEPPVLWEAQHDPRQCVPRIAHVDLEAAIERGDGELGRGDIVTSLQKQLSEQRLGNRVPSFSFSDVVPWLERQSQARISFMVRDRYHEEPRRGIQRLEGDPAITGDADTTVVWIHEQRVHALGRGSDRLTSLLAPHHHVVVADATANAFREALRTHNPFNDQVIQQLVADGREVGLDLTPWLQKHIEEISAVPSDTDVLALDEKQESSARSLLQEICSRAWQIPGGPGKGAWSSEAVPPPTIPLWLRRAVNSPLLLVAPDDFCQLRVIASIGAGRVLHIRLSRFSATAPTPLTVTREKEAGRFEVDGGDVHMWLREAYDEMLEADSLVPRRNRKEAEAASAYDEDDDD